MAPPILKGTGGEVIRKRNLDLIKEYVGDNNILHFVLDFYSLYKISDKDYEYENRVQIIESKLKEVIDNYKPDLIYLDNSLMKIPNFIFEYKTMVFLHNVEASYARQDKNINSNLLTMIEENERNIISKASYVICINDRDSRQINRLYKRSADYILPISFVDKYIEYKESSDNTFMLFVGTDFYGNTDGLFWFIDNCLDKINSNLIVVGKGMEKYNNKFIGKKVRFLGAMDDLSILYANASLVVLPIISGSGMKTKTCEAFMYGKKCFGTSEAFEGYENINESGAILCNSADDFINNINDYLTNNSNYIEEARYYFLSNYEHNVIKHKYYDFLSKKVNI